MWAGGAGKGVGERGRGEGAVRGGGERGRGSWGIDPGLGGERRFKKRGLGGEVGLPRGRGWREGVGGRVRAGGLGGRRERNFWGDGVRI